MTRDEHQDRAVLFLEDRQRLICKWATGTGKSQVVLRFLKKHKQYKTLILVPEQNNIENWEYEFNKFNVSLENVEIACYASMHKYKDSYFDLLVFDEAPHVNTDLKKYYCQSITTKYVLALGAVITDEQKEALTSLYGSFAEYTINMSMAINQGLLPSPEIWIIHTVLNDIVRNCKYRGQMVSEKAYYDILTARVEQLKDEYDKHPNKQNKERMLFAGSNRKRFLGKCKEETIRFLCDKLDRNNRRYLCFCSSIQQAVRIGKENAYTSKTPVSAKLLDKFNNKEINSLFVVGKLIEGQNLNDIECGVLGSIGGTDRITVQSIGRVMRSAKPVIYVPVIDNTKDEDFLKTVTFNIPKDYIKHYKF